jgi:phasin family protein
MNITPDKLVASFKSGVDTRLGSLSAAGTSVLSALGGLTELNIGAARAAVDDAVALSQGLLAAKEPKALAELWVGALTPALQKSLAYGKSVGAIAMHTQAELLKLVEAEVAHGLQHAIVTLESLNKDAPAGSEFAVKALKTVIANTATAYESAAQAAKQVSEAAQANVDSAAEAAIESVSKTTKAAASMLKSAA